MSSKRHVRRKACERKRRFICERDAAEAARSATRYYGNPLREYHCCFCQGYHIGHNEGSLGMLGDVQGHKHRH